MAVFASKVGSGGLGPLARQVIWGVSSPSEAWRVVYKSWTVLLMCFPPDESFWINTTRFLSLEFVSLLFTSELVRDGILKHLSISSKYHTTFFNLSFIHKSCQDLAAWSVLLSFFFFFLMIWMSVWLSVLLPRVWCDLCPWQGLCTPISASSKVVALVTILRLKNSATVSVSSLSISAYTCLSKLLLCFTGYYLCFLTIH